MGAVTQNRLGCSRVGEIKKRDNFGLPIGAKRRNQKLDCTEKGREA